MDELERAEPRSGRVTISDVASLAGVSPAAVSKVFNQTGSISAATTERIMDAARRLKWRPSAAATALRRSRSQTVGLVINKITDTIDIGASTAVFLSGIESVLSPKDYGLLLYVIERDTEFQERSYRTLAETRRIDGLLLTDSIIDDPRFDLMREIGLPSVLIGSPWGDDPIPHVDSEPPAGGLPESVRHLLDHGHRRIAYIGGPQTRVQALMRRTALDGALAEAGLTPFASICTRYLPEEAAFHTTELLSGSERPTAIIYASDAMAIVGIRTALLHGIRVPTDLSVIGYDGLALGEWTEPQLTTVRRDSAQRGKAGAAKLLELLGETIEERYPLSSPQLIVRGSTGPAPAFR
jgi:DNA-binding LacI/PurR family transcriptional regulator